MIKPSSGPADYRNKGPLALKFHHAAWEQSGDFASELGTELHPAFFCRGRRAFVVGLIEQHPQPTLAMKPGGEA